MVWTKNSPSRQSIISLSRLPPPQYLSPSVLRPLLFLSNNCSLPLLRQRSSKLLHIHIETYPTSISMHLPPPLLISHPIPSLYPLPIPIDLLFRRTRVVLHLQRWLIFHPWVKSNHIISLHRHRPIPLTPKPTINLSLLLLMFYLHRLFRNRLNYLFLSFFLLRTRTTPTILLKLLRYFLITHPLSPIRLLLTLQLS